MLRRDETVFPGGQFHCGIGRFARNAAAALVGRRKNARTASTPAAPRPAGSRRLFYWQRPFGGMPRRSGGPPAGRYG